MSFEQRARELVAQLTLEEKAALCSGRDFWSTRPVERLGLPSITMSDGPHGLRKVSHSMMGEAVPATCFPTASALASSWDTELAERCGAAMAKEAQANDVHVILGPGINMKRSPLGGRNFEYYSEDPVLSARMAIAQIRGIQSEGVGVSLKHYAANNQETERFTSSSDPDPRTLHEIYLSAFETVVKEAAPWSLMAAYNKLYGTYATENALLLQRILREQWGYRGVVVSDWGAVNDRVAALMAGLHLEMPGTENGNPERLVRAVREGRLDEARLDELVGELVQAVLTVHDGHRPGTTFDADEHHALAREAASASVVLLKNEGDLLPGAVQNARTIAVVGSFARTPRYQGSGSSQVRPTRLSNALEALERTLGEAVTLRFCEGYMPDGTTHAQLLQEAAAAAAAADVALVFAGLPEHYESEGFDRERLDLPEGHERLIEAVVAAQPRTAVVLMNGSAVTMPWVDRVPTLFEAWLGGQAAGEAIADALTGTVNPSGKLSETFPVRLEHTPAHPYFPAKDGVARYGEGLLIGYRYYDTRCLEPLFPFGHGLSYTRFAYSDLTLSSGRIQDSQTVTLRLSVTNTGARFGREVVQVYVGDRTNTVVVADKTLRAFDKVSLNPGERKTLEFTLSFRDFAHYDPSVEDWVVSSGRFEVMVGGSSRDLPLRESLEVESTRTLFAPLTRLSLLKHVGAHPRGKSLYQELLRSVAQTFGQNPEEVGAPKPSPEFVMWERTVQDTLLYKFVENSEGKLTEPRLDEALAAINRRPS